MCDKTGQQPRVHLNNRESEQRVRETAEMLPCIICEADLDLRFTYANKRGLETFGYSREEFDKGITLSQVLLEEDRQRAEQDIKNVLAGDFGNPAEYKLKCKNGNIIDLLVNTAPLIKDGRPCGLRKGEFREDLFYRINVLSIKLPPLRERRGDIPLLCSHFIGIFNTRYEKEVKQISKNALDLLIAYDFPGNIRELENIMEHAFVFCKGAAILADHLPEEFRQVSPSAGGLSAFNGIDDFEKLEKMYLENILKQTGNNKLQAAERLGINRSTLFRKMKKLGI